MARDRKVSPPEASPNPFDTPGSLVRTYAQRKNWPLSTRNVMLEGRSDSEYFRIAAEKYQEHDGRKLICNKLSLFQVGDGDAGGADNIKDKFMFLREVLSTENYCTTADQIMAIVLLDNDHKGREVAHFLDKRGLRLNRDVFLMARNIPRTTRDPCQLGRLITSISTSCVGIDCEIEDLLSRDLLELFSETEPRCLAREPQFRDAGHHFEWTPDGKAKLLRFVREEASYSDVSGIVEVLKSLRYLLRLAPDGV